jgi:hypothetical protein
MNSVWRVIEDSPMWKQDYSNPAWRLSDPVLRHVVKPCVYASAVGLTSTIGQTEFLLLLDAPDDDHNGRDMSGFAIIY